MRHLIFKFKFFWKTVFNTVWKNFYLGESLLYFLKNEKKLISYYDEVNDVKYMYFILQKNGYFIIHWRVIWWVGSTFLWFHNDSSSIQRMTQKFLNVIIFSLLIFYKYCCTLQLWNNELSTMLGAWDHPPSEHYEPIDWNMDLIECNWKLIDFNIRLICRTWNSIEFKD